MTEIRTGGQALELLPALYRTRDARPDGKPGFLESVLTVIVDQLAVVDADLDQLYDDLFIETCDAWVVPYIGDLVGVLPGAPGESGAVLTRAAVADAIALRRRKGTAAVLEQLAHDVTGWPAVAVEMFQRMVVAQHVRHVVASRGSTLSMRVAVALERLGTAFDPAAHTLDVRRIGSGRGRYNARNVAVLVWRDVPLPLTWADAGALDAQRFRFSPLGVDQPLATAPSTERTLAHHTTPLNVPGVITRRALAAAPADYYGPGRSLAIRRAGDQLPVDLADIVACDLADSAVGGAGPGGSTWSNVHRLRPGQVGVDPALGRLAFGTAQPGPPQVSFVTTAPSDVGGSEGRARPPTPLGQPVTHVRRDGAGGAATSIAAGFTAAGGSGTVEIGDSRTYSEDLSVRVPAGAQFRVVGGAGWLPVIDLLAPLTITVGEAGVLTFVGLVVAGGTLVVRGRPDRVELTDCTFVPGQRLDADAQVTAPVGPSVLLDLDADWQTEIVVANCVTGPLHVPADGSTLRITDSIVDGVADGLGRSAESGAPARIVPALRSPAPLGTSGLALPAGSTTLRLTLGTDAPRLVDLGSVPPDVRSAASLLDAALTGSGARALAIEDQVVLVGDGRALAVTAVAGSGLADGLGLTSPSARTRVVLGGVVDVAGAASGGTLTVTGRPGEEWAVHVGAGASDLTSLAVEVQAAVRAAAATLAGVGVGALDGALVVIPADAAAVTFTGARTDQATAGSLGLVSPRPAIAADFTGTPGAILGLTRCTVLGAVDVTAVDTVTDSIVTGRVTCERRQTGCVQYSWIPPGSRTPRQHECQPAAPDTPAPSFVSRHYATAGYGRLRRAGATALVRGAGDGFEMGAMARLRQTQRDDNLRRGIEEFLRFGLEAGVLDGD